MRKLILAAIALATSLIALPASAQSLDQVVGALTGITNYGYNSCSYVNGGFGQAACQANRALNTVRTVRDITQQNDYRRREQFDRRTRQLEALQRACKAGDQQSCARSGGSDEGQMTVARALMDACTAGDRASCRRAEGMMSERNVSSYGQRGYGQTYRQPAPRSYASAQTCTPVYDQRTGYRIAGMCAR